EYAWRAPEHPLGPPEAAHAEDRLLRPFGKRRADGCTEHQVASRCDDRSVTAWKGLFSRRHGGGLACEQHATRVPADDRPVTASPPPPSRRTRPRVPPPRARTTSGKPRSSPARRHVRRPRAPTTGGSVPPAAGLVRPTRRPRSSRRPRARPQPTGNR